MQQYARRTGPFSDRTLLRSNGPTADCRPTLATLQWRMPRDPYIREKFTRDRTYARKLAAEYFERFPKEPAGPCHQSFGFMPLRIRRPMRAYLEIVISGRLRRN